MKKPKQKFPEYPSNKKADVYEMDGVRYIHEDLIQDKMSSIMERIAVAQEKQCAMYERMEKMMNPMMKVIFSKIPK